MRIEFDDREAGIAPPRYLHLPTVDNTAPSLDNLGRGISFIQDVLRRGGSFFFVHCEAGVGRAPTMAVAYLSYRGVPGENAWDILRRKRPFIRPTESQVWLVKRFERSGGVGRIGVPALLSSGEESIKGR
jgi:protein-tyrosine phosphatase